MLKLKLGIMNRKPVAQAPVAPPIDEVTRYRLLVAQVERRQSRDQLRAEQRRNDAIWAGRG